MSLESCAKAGGWEERGEAPREGQLCPAGSRSLQKKGEIAARPDLNARRGRGQGERGGLQAGDGGSGPPPRRPPGLPLKQTEQTAGSESVFLYRR